MSASEDSFNQFGPLQGKHAEACWALEQLATRIEEYSGTQARQLRAFAGCVLLAGNEYEETLENAEVGEVPSPIAMIETIIGARYIA